MSDEESPSPPPADDDNGASSRPSSSKSSRPSSSKSSRPSSSKSSRPSSSTSTRPQSARSSRASSAKSRQSRPASAVSAASVQSQPISRQGSARSHKSVTWTTAGDEDLLIDVEKDGVKHKSKKKKQSCLDMIISGMWETREMLKDTSDKQLYVKTTLRELTIYSIFMFIICYMTFVQYSPTYYTYTKMMKGLFSKQMDVTNMQLFWNFVEKDLLDGIYWETWYNKGYRNAQVTCPDGELAKQPCKVPEADRQIMYENRVLGLPRIRQLKVRSDSCAIPADFQKAIKVCYAEYSADAEDKETYMPTFRNYSDEWAWTYQTDDDLNGNSHTGQIGSYSGAGYVQNLHYLKDQSSHIVSEMKEALWITQGTRFVTIDFTVYNVNVNLFCITKMTFEFPATGGVIPYQQFTSVKLLKYTETADYFLMACEVIFGLFILYYVIEESLEIKTHKLRYFLNIWNLLDLLVIGISVAQMFYNYFLIFSTPGRLDGLLAKPFQFADFSDLASSSRLLTTFSALNVFVAWIKVFKYLSFNKTMTQLSGTLGAAAKDLSGFSIMFFIIFFAFVQLGYLLFGTQVKDFRSFIDSVYTLFRMILGDFNFRDIEKANYVLGPIYFLSYIFFVFFVLLNMFLAIINDTYGDVKAEIKTRKPDFQMSDFFKTGLNNVKSSLGIHDRAVDVENAIKLAAADDGFVTYEELRENLRNARFSDVEIDLFFYHFQNDPVISQIILDEEEVKAKQLSEEKRRMSRRMSTYSSLSVIMDDSDGEDDGFGSDEEERPKSGKQARRARSARIMSAAAIGPDGGPTRREDMVPDQDFYNLQRRVDRMEQSVAPLAQKLDVVVARFGVGVGDAGDKKMSKNQMEMMFDQILQADDVDDSKKCQQMEDFVRSWENSRPGSTASSN